MGNPFSTNVRPRWGPITTQCQRQKDSGKQVSLNIFEASFQTIQIRVHFQKHLQVAGPQSGLTFIENQHTNVTDSSGVAHRESCIHLKGPVNLKMMQ